MRTAALFLILAMAGAPFTYAQDGQAAPTSRHSAFRLNLEPLFMPGYEAGHELRLALWDSPMSRLELAAAREEWALRNPGPTGPVIPFQQLTIPQHLDFSSNAQRLLLGPWSGEWSQLTWQEKVAAGAETGVLALVLIEIARHVR